ncbi:tRNA nucleotidyltransferase [Methylosinus sp. Sm6]|uniref:tRNA nucleotidyltransferase n=1 Tax=Methylosinus sp. Sm6 TaxID=2866948 RepID=UPI001C99073B|nr:tRNA nucleotidyltransferase [Methylosinus sp. Sm6]MBY6242972.1 tRNA nucleotidyltransferase [Methylosinus sp. Sm6]
MSDASFPTPDFGQTHPGLGVLRMAVLLAEAEDATGDDVPGLMAEQIEAGCLDGVAYADVWAELEPGLMGRAPGRLLRILRGCGALERILPEVDALFGVPQISDGQGEVDLGEHLLAALDEAATLGAPLSVRFALLTMNVGKSDSPPEHLPVHYKHIERGVPRVDAIAERFGAPADCRELALLALAECERVHRASEVRAGPVALMLERLGAFDARERFDRLMMVCACDFRGHGDRDKPYAKAALLAAALAACAAIDDPSAEARAAAIAAAFRSQRWSSETA